MSRKLLIKNLLKASFLAQVIYNKHRITLWKWPNLTSLQTESNDVSANMDIWRQKPFSGPGFELGFLSLHASVLGNQPGDQG